MSRPDASPEHEHLLDFVNAAAMGRHRVAGDGSLSWANEADDVPRGHAAVGGEGRGAARTVVLPRTPPWGSIHGA